MSSEDRLFVERRPTPNFERGRGGDRPRAIVLHTTSGSFDGAARWFATRDSGVSAHYLVGLDGRVVQFVEEADTARHAGRVLRPTAAIVRGGGNPNRFTVGIEFEDAGEPESVRRTEAQHRSGARLIAGIARRWAIPLDREHVIGHREVFAAKSCPGNLDLERMLAGARRAAGGGEDAPAGEIRLACLLAARNAEQDLPEYLDCVESLRAPLVALDDGSTDRTAELLQASPQVVRLLHNPRRTSYAEWDDAANRQRLLDAAVEIGPRWVLFLDADERIDADDARALRDFLATDALPGLAYGLRVHRAWEDAVEVKPRHVYRLFAVESGQLLGTQRLHFNPVPDTIPRSAWVRTTIRLRHLDSPARLAERREKYRQADPERRFELAYRPLLEPPQRTLGPWSPRPEGWPVLDVGEGPAPPAEGADAGVATVLCLLPARNCEADLPGWLESVRPLADGVVALDDGSTDRTAELLQASPQVVRLLHNPRRTSYAEWDDAANRQRLLDAAVEIGPSWVLFLDADERIDADDARALRRFLEEGGETDHAYGFRVHRMVGDMSRYDRAGLWVYRLFRPETGQRLPDARLHLVPVPTSIPRERWRRTTVRIQHLAGLTDARRRARLHKYEQADPDLAWQDEYRNSILAPGEPKSWKSRPPGLPVLAQRFAGAGAIDLEELDLDAPVLSAIVISRDDEEAIERSVGSVVAQECPVPFEVVVVTSGTDRTAEIVRERFPGVVLVELDGRALPGRARNAGLALARGEYVSFPGSHVELPPGSLAARVRAHERGWPMVTGSILNGTTTRSGWASYFLDHSSALPGRPSAKLEAAPAHCSYVRQFLVEAGGFPEDMRAGEDTVANHAMWRRGHRAYREREVQLTHRSPCTNPARLIRHHFVRGRALGQIMLGEHGGGRPTRRPKRALRFLTGYGRRRLAATDQRVADWGPELTGEYRRARPLVVLGIAAAWAGAALELGRPRRRRAGHSGSVI